MDLGSQLRVTREQRGLTLEEVCARTKIPRRLLADLEMDDIASWPKQRIYQVGFLRAYASEVGLNAEQVVAQFVASCPEHRAESSVTTRERGLIEPAPPKVVLGAATVIACLFVAFFIRIPTPDGAADPGVSLPKPLPHATSGVQLERRYTEATIGAAELTAADVPTDSEVEGQLLIDSNPSDAWVVVNGIGRGRTPARIQYLPAGSYTIRLVRAGYRSSEQRVTLTSERPERSLRITLRELAR
jgi:transcriptional regulator with XRE-family HTH domain